MSTNHSSGSLSRLLNKLGQVEPSESRAVVTAFLLFFFVLGGYFAVRPVRETFATVMGRDAVADLWIITSIGAVIIVPIYGALVAWVRRAILLPGICRYSLWLGTSRPIPTACLPRSSSTSTSASSI